MIWRYAGALLVIGRGIPTATMTAKLFKNKKANGPVGSMDMGYTIIEAVFGMQPCSWQADAWH